MSTARPHINSVHSDFTNNHADFSTEVTSLALTASPEATMSDGRKFKYRSLNSEVSLPDFNTHVLELSPTSYSGSRGSTPTSAFILAPDRPSTQYLDSPSKHPLISPPHYTAKVRSKPRGKHPFSPGFEAPRWGRILLHTVLCIVSYPILLAITLIARNKSFFWSRFIVGVGCGFVGVYLGYSLLKLAKRHLEAATWATVIHQSHFDDSPGVRLRDLAATSEDPTSVWTALRLLWNRAMHPGLFESRIGITIDNIDAPLPFFQNFALTWTMSPFSTHGGLPPVVSFNWNNDTIYFSETIISQLLPNGSGFGTFDSDTVDASLTINPTGEVNEDPQELLDQSLTTNLADTQNGESVCVAKNSLTPT
ncbi:hypothetical protein H0H87_002188 [Tephrocybe sp. NHM501043]|nr:hypothetical protein H0H87_002188 [Tephrocybe sp. NHM501043]